MPLTTVERLKKYMDNPKFTPNTIEKVSVACKNLCFWIRSVYQFNAVWQLIKYDSNFSVLPDFLIYFCRPIYDEQETQTQAIKETQEQLQIIRSALEVLERRIEFIIKIFLLNHNKNEIKI
jgi:hypothetical protein